jgi:hypothetical protein
MSYVRVGIIGTIAGGEVWSVNPTFDPTGEFPGGVNQTALDAAALAIATLNPGPNLLAMMSTALQLTQCRLEVRDDATDNLIGISIAGRATPLSGSGGAAMPAQSSIVASLRTNTPGGSGRGRMYWPGVGASITSGLRLNALTHAALPAEFKTYLLAMRTALANAFPTIGFDLAVRSKTTHTTPHVVRLQVGDVIDTQRRRRDTLPETYVSTTFP